MYYNVALADAKKLLFFIKKIIQCGDEDGAGIPEPVGNGDVIQFLIPVGYRHGNGGMKEKASHEGKGKVTPFFQDQFM
ncbi:hypothetical protein MTR_3g098440 [Medicago truncatula]|uniref:Uncharacterized protein n=1 Tax=Medicago truncatula TaxID=3880 RepID=G7J2R8_MEDTR|nr:hypothetical protein MTR_3g098440 [Medicago truncatula]